MGAIELLAKFKSEGLTLMAEGDRIAVEPKSAITDYARTLIRQHKAELLPLLRAEDDQVATQDEGPLWGSVRQGEADREGRYERVESMLAKSPAIRYALVTNAEGDLDDVVLTLAIRDLGTCELRTPKAKYDPFLIIRLLDEHEGTIQ
jgi:hypothetical protein